MKAQPYHLFNRRLLIQRQRRFSSPSLHFLDQVVVQTISERLLGIKRSFSKVLLIGRASMAYGKLFPESEIICWGEDVLFDEEFLPFQSQSVDLIISHLTWHWVNDLPGTLIQIKDILKPDGLLMAALFGGNSLWQLRQCLCEAEETLTGGVSPRIAPMISAYDGAALLQRAGFALPVVDHDHLTCYYDTLESLIKDLRIYGQANLLDQQPKTFSPRLLFNLAHQLYREKFATPQGLPVSSNIIYLTGWSPSPIQQQPLLPGSGQVKLHQVLS